MVLASDILSYASLRFGTEDRLFSLKLNIFVSQKTNQHFRSTHDSGFRHVFLK